MGGTVLVMFPLTEGEALVQALEQAGFPLKAAFWLYFEEADAWRLVLASSLIDEEGPRRVYQRIQRVIEDRKIAISLADISAVSPEDDLVKPLREALSEREKSSGMWVKKSVVTGSRNSVYLEEAYIYFARM